MNTRDALADRAVEQLLREIDAPGICEFRHGFSYPGLHRRTVMTDLAIIHGGEKPVVIATERSDNPGASITNTIESLAAAVARDFGWSVKHFVLIEHYPPGRYDSASRWTEGLKRELDRVTFPGGIRVAWDGSALAEPEWRTTSIDQLRTLVGAPLATGSAKS